MRLFINKLLLISVILFISNSLISNTDDNLDLVNKIKNEKNERLYVFTHPRSGTHWILYILQFFTNRLITFSHTESSEPFKFDLNLETNNNKPYIHACHTINPIFLDNNCMPACNFENDKILILIRNPLECIIREWRHAAGQTNDEIIKLEETNYFLIYQNLEFFEKWPKKNRHLIYYEDLMVHPKDEIEKLLKFIGVNNERLNSFIENIDFHSETCLQLYNELHHSSGGSHSKGKDLFFHSKDLPDNVKNDIIHILYNQNRHLFNNYFNRYFQID